MEPVTAGEPARLLISRVGPSRIGLFLANANDRNERAILPADSLDYDPSFSADGKWIVFTSERRKPPVRRCERVIAPDHGFPRR